MKRISLFFFEAVQFLTACHRLTAPSQNILRQQFDSVADLSDEGHTADDLRGFYRLIDDGADTDAQGRYHLSFSSDADSLVLSASGLAKNNINATDVATVRDAGEAPAPERQLVC